MLYLLVAFIALWVAVVCTGNQLPAETLLAATPQSGGDEVALTVTVTNKQGYVTGLSRADFSIFAGKTPLEITSFSFGEEPMSIGIVYDKSRSSNDQYNYGVAVSKTFRNALGRFLQLSNASNDYFLIRVAQKPQSLVDWNRDHHALLSALENLESESYSALYDAYFMALEKLATGKYQKRVLLLISDGSDNRSRGVIKDSAT